MSAWGSHAGRVPLIVQSMAARADDTACEALASPEDAVRLVADAVRQAGQFEMPVICHVYPRDFSDAVPKVSYAPEDIAWAVRCAVEAGADVVKAPYCGEIQAYAQIVAECPVPVVAAGGPKSDSIHSALEMISDVMRTGARGATIGRNVWGFEQITAAVHAFKAVVHESKTPAEAALVAGL